MAFAVIFMQIESQEMLDNIRIFHIDSHSIRINNQCSGYIFHKQADFPGTVTLLNRLIKILQYKHFVNKHLYCLKIKLFCTN